MEWCIKGVNRSASSSFSPDGAYIAAGTMAGAVDLQFSSSANLDIFELDFASDNKQLPLSGTAPSSERFNRLSWGRANGNSDEYSLGLIAGGLVDGNIGLWNPKHLTDPASNEKAFVGNLSRHKGPVRGLEFNSLAPHLIASGADEGDICIWDVTKPLEPTHFPPLKGSGSATQGEISFLSWNSKVQHILASTSYNGATVVWDLKKQKPVISFSDSIRRRSSVLQWNPDVATQLVVASDEDNSPSLRLWDMRNVLTPVKEFVGHTKGVIAMSWCPFDSSYLLTCAKDNRTICWDTASGEIVGELPAGTNWNFDIHWYSKIPGVISASSFDGKIGIYNIEGCGRYGVEESDFGAAQLKVPKWYKRKAGVSFGFGGKLVSFNSTESPAGSSEVYVKDLVTETGLVGRSSEFEAAIQNGDRSALKLFCEKKSQESESEEERDTWSFMRVMFAEDGTSRTNLLTHLGFSLPAKESDVVLNDVSEQVNALGLDDGIINKEEVSGYKESALHLLATDNGEDFFNNLPSPKADTPLATSKDEFVIDDSVMETEQDIDAHEESADHSFDDVVQRALVVGDYKGAVEQCISANRWADALVISHVGGVSLWDRTRDQYLKTSQSPYLKIVSAMVNNDLMSIANTRPLRSWKETLALFCAFSQAEEWTLLCDALASRLMAAGNTSAATLCYICAGNIDKAVEMWSKDLSIEHEGKTYVDRLQDLMEKTIVFAWATGQKQYSASLCKLVEKYAEILSSQGLLTTAMEYLNLLGTEDLSTELVILRDRIAMSIEPAKEIEKSVVHDNSRFQTEPTYPAAVEQPNYRVDANQHYYAPQLQDVAPSHHMQQQMTPSNSYGENYSQQGYSAPPTYNGPGYSAPTYNGPGYSGYQQIPQHNVPQQPAIFVPSVTPAPVENFPPVTVPNQQAPVKFNPVNPPQLKNMDQYQQPSSSLASQLYPGGGSNPSYQAGPSVGPSFTAQHGPNQGQRVPQVMNPAQSRGFTPMNNNSLGVQRSPAQPSSPTQQHQQQQPPVVAPPPTVQTVDTSNVPVQLKPVIATLTRLFNETSEAWGGAHASAIRKREIEEISKKFGSLFAKLNTGDISKNAAEKLVQLCQALEVGDIPAAMHIQVLLTTSDWDECNSWLAALKRMIKTIQGAR